jgi:hypothetical protein
MPAEKAIESLRELHPGLSEKILAFSSGVINLEMIEVIKRYGLRQISRETLLPQVWATLEEFVATSRIIKLAPRSLEVAQLILDNFRLAAQEDARNSAESGRHLIYRHKNKVIDLLITPDVDTGRVLLAGQVMSVGMGIAKDKGLVVLLVDGMKTVALTTTNQSGGFQLEFEIGDNLVLQIRLREGPWAATALGKMDWARKRLANWTSI